MLPPLVTGISPKEGPPGTRVIIRGENLGIDANDLIGLYICDVDCLLSAEWNSPNKIVARSAPGRLRGDIIVITRSGGSGTSTVQFRSYYEKVGPLQESSVWVDEDIPSIIQTVEQFIDDSLDDPLGLSDEACEKRIPEEKLQDLFPEGSGNLNDINFEPAWWLLENHYNTSYDDLFKGLTHLKRKVESQKDSRVSFLKSNISAIFEQLNALQILKYQFEQNEKELGLDPTQSLIKTVKDSVTEAEYLFHEVLGRKETADCTRNALSVLRRFRFLFNLPHIIDENIEKENYSVVINDYIRIRNLFANTEVKVFQKVFKEVQDRIENLKNLLWQKLKCFPSTLDVQKRLIKNLINLEVDDDPAYICLISYHEHGIAALKSCLSDYIGNKFNIAIQDGVLVRINYLECLTSIFMDNINNLWKLWITYSEGEFNHIPSSEQKVHCQDLLFNHVIYYDRLVRIVFVPNTLEDLTVDEKCDDLQLYSNLLQYLPQALRIIRDASHHLDLPTMSEVHLQVVKKLIIDFRIRAADLLLHEAFQQVKNLNIYSNDLWKAVADESWGDLIELPKNFDNILIYALIQVSDTLHREEKKEINPLTLPQVNQHLKPQLQAILEEYARVIESLALNLKTSNIITENNNICIKILLLLNVVQYSIKVTLPTIRSHLIGFRIPTVSDMLYKWHQSLIELEKFLLNLYVDEKGLPIMGSIEKNMYFGEFSWAHCAQPKDVQSYIKELILDLVSVYSEVSWTSPAYLVIIMNSIVHLIIEEILRLFQCVSKSSFTAVSSLQAQIDLEAFEKILSHFITSDSRKLLEQIYSLSSELTLINSRETMQKILDKFYTSFHLVASALL